DIAVAVAANRGTRNFAVRSLVADTHLHRFQTVQNVQLGQADTGHTVDLDGMAQRHRIKPATTTGTTCGGPHFVPLDRQVLAHVVKQFGRERAGTYPGGVSLGNTQHVVQIQRAKTGAGSGAASGGIGGSHVRIGTQVDIQQRALRAFEQDVLSALAVVVQNVGYVCGHGQDFLAHLLELFQGRIDILGLFLEVLGENEVVVRHDFPQLDLEISGVAQVTQPNTPAGNLVFIRRADTPTGSTNLVVATGTLAGLIDTNVGAQDDRASQADFQAVTNGNTVRFKLPHFFQQGFRRQHHTVPDEALDILPQYAGRNQVQSRLLTFDHQCVTGIMPALKADNGSHLVCQKVNNLALAFITPLGAQHNYVFTHDS